MGGSEIGPPGPLRGSWTAPHASGQGDKTQTCNDAAKEMMTSKELRHHHLLPKRLKIFSIFTNRIRTRGLEARESFLSSPSSTATSEGYQNARNMLMWIRPALTRSRRQTQAENQWCHSSWPNSSMLSATDHSQTGPKAHVLQSGTLLHQGVSYQFSVLSLTLPKATWKSKWKKARLKGTLYRFPCRHSIRYAGDYTKKDIG
jgi:hypothetical protein